MSETTNPHPCTCREGLQELLFLHPPLDLIAFSCDPSSTHPGTALQGNQPLLEAPHVPFPALQRKPVMSSGRFPSCLHCHKTTLPPFKDAAGAVSSQINETAAARCCGSRCGGQAEEGLDVQLCVRHLSDSSCKYVHRTQPLQHTTTFPFLHTGEKRLQAAAFALM